METGTVRVLLVEDNPGDARLLRELLVDAGPDTFIVDHAGSLADALDLLAKNGAYQVVLLDLELPDSTGFETIDRVQTAAARIPIVVLTGRDDDAWGERAIEKGVQDYLVKGQIVPKRLGRVIRYATQRNQAEQDRLLLLEAERAARSASERLNRMKDEFLATVSHELRSPLSAILGWTRLAMSGKTQEVGRALEIIERNASSLAQLIEDLLDMGRITSGKIRLSLQTIEPEDLIRTVVEGFQIALDNKQIEIEYRIQPDLHPVHCDTSRIQQVLSNLLSNAVKFTPEGGRIVVYVEQSSNELNIRVQDNGIGISSQILPHVFDKFLQADSSTARHHSGLGLGLAIVKHLVEMHGGAVRAESEGEGKGATFTIALPMKARLTSNGNDEQEASTPAKEDADRLPEGLVVLVVDDDRDAGNLISRLLTDSGARVLTVNTAAQAWIELQRNRPDILISDISMPGEDGYHLIRRVRSSTESFAGMSCIALTSLARPEDRNRALQSGFDIHVSKLADPSELIQAIRRMIPETISRRFGRQKDLMHIEQSAADAGACPRPAHILLAEDNEIIAELLTICLELEGYRVSTAESVSEALALINESPVDLLLSDLRLKDGTGWELMTKIRETQTLPGIMLSGYSDEAYQCKSKEAGFQEYLVKPVDDEQLCKVVAAILGKTQQKE